MKVIAINFLRIFIPYKIAHNNFFDKLQRLTRLSRKQKATSIKKKEPNPITNLTVPRTI